MLTKHGDGYEPLLLGSDSSWSLADVELVPIASGTPLSPGTVSPDGRMAAFPQPGELVTVDAWTAEVTHYDVPTEDLRSVSWLGDAQRVLVSGPGVAYRVLVGEGGFGEGPLVKINGASDPEAITAPFRLDTGAVGRYTVSGQWIADSRSVATGPVLGGSDLLVEQHGRPALRLRRPSASPDEGLPATGRGGDLHSANADQPSAGAGEPDRATAEDAPRSGRPGACGSPAVLGAGLVRRQHATAAGPRLGLGLGPVLRQSAASHRTRVDGLASDQASDPEPSFKMARKVILDQAAASSGGGIGCPVRVRMMNTPASHSTIRTGSAEVRTGSPRPGPGPVRSW